jgi:hypothetical protein
MTDLVALLIGEKMNAKLTSEKQGVDREERGAAPRFAS